MIEKYFDDILQEVLISRAVTSFKVLRRLIGEDDGFIRIICRLLNDNIFEFAEYVQIQKNRVHLITYSFHWQSADGKLVKRWDNVKHHKNIKTFPCHLHLPDGRVIGSSPMNLKKVIAEIEKALPVTE